MNRYIQATSLLFLCICVIVVLVGCYAKPSESVNSLSAHHLEDAISQQNYDDIRFAAESGANMDQVVIDGVSYHPILYLWETSPRPLWIEQVLKNGSNVNYADAKGNTLLMYASGYQPQEYGFQSVSANYSTLDYCKLFLQYGADVSLQNEDGWTALDFAVQLHGDDETVDVLLQNGAAVTQQVLQNALSQEDSYTDYKKLHRLFTVADPATTARVAIAPILNAAICGENETVQQLSPKAASLSAEEKLQTLCYAAAFCESDTVNLLLSSGFGSLTSTDVLGNTLLELAAAQGNTKVLSSLLTQETWSTETYKSALQKAIDGSHTEVCQQLLNAGTPVISGTVDNWEVFNNIMDCAAENGNVEIIDLLVQYGYPVNETTAWYAMKNAARFGQIAVIQYFSKLGYDPDYNSENNSVDTSVLWDACWAEQIETVTYLLREGCNVNAAQKCLPAAVETGNLELVGLLLDHGADVNAATVYEDGSNSLTPQEVAEQHGFGEILTLLEHHERLVGGHGND